MGLKQTIQLFLLGKRNIIRKEDAIQILSRTPQSRTAEHKKLIQKSEETFKYYIFGSAIASIIINTINIRYFQNKFKIINTGRWITDLAVVTLCFGMGTLLTIIKIEPQINLIKKDLLNLYDKKFIQNMNRVASQYQITIQQQLDPIMNKQQKSLWIKYNVI